MLYVLIQNSPERSPEQALITSLNERHLITLFEPVSLDRLAQL
jgi:hypothetical protein